MHPDHFVQQMAAERRRAMRELARGRVLDDAVHDREARSRSVLVLACEQLWRRTVGGSFDRLPDPARHPECWFKFL